jgi:predicted kinase
MDLEFRGHRDLALVFLREYIAASGDAGVSDLVDFYSIYRAFIRGKVGSFRLKDPGIQLVEKEAAKEKAISYFRLARGYILRQRLAPALIVVCGLTGSGKSTIAVALAIELGLALLSSDRIRKELAGVPLWQHSHDEYGSGLYSPAASEATYRELLARADRSLAAGQSVIIDATCQKRRVRESLHRLAANHEVPLYLFVAEAPEEVIRERLAERIRQKTAISDGRWEIYQRQKAEFEPVLASEGAAITLESSGLLCETVDTILGAIGLLPRPEIQMLTKPG